MVKFSGNTDDLGRKVLDHLELEQVSVHYIGPDERAI